MSKKDKLKTSKAERGYQGSIQTTLERFDGSLMELFRWIGLYKALVHDTDNTVAEKLATLQQDLITLALMSGGSEIEYEEYMKNSYVSRR